MSDASQQRQCEEKLQNAVNRLHKLIPQYSSAKQIIEFSSDRRKNLLAKHQLAFIKIGESVAGSEACARSDGTYMEEFRVLEEQEQEAQRVIAEWRVWEHAFQGAQSLLAMIRETTKTLGA